MKVTVIVEIGKRTVTEQLVTEEDHRGDYRQAISECISRAELSTFGPTFTKEGHSFDEPLQAKPLI
jgi:hypothetical protein